MKALLFEGGGAKGAYEAGAVKALNKKKIYFDGVGGTSIGAFNAAFYAQKNFNGMYKLWLSVDSQELFGIEPKLLLDFQNRNITMDNIKKGLTTVGKIIKNRGIDTENIMKFLRKYVKEDRIRRSKIDYALNTYSLSDRKPGEVFKKDIPVGKMHEYILSSAYLPIFKFERIIDDKYYVDGGVYSNCPIDLFVEAGYDEIYVLRAWQNKLKYKNTKKAKIHIIGPREDLGSIMLFEKQTAEYRFNLGYFDMIKYLDNLDGNKYYFKHYSDEYYDNLFDKNTLNRMIKILNKGKKPKSNKDFILNVIEKICSESKIERFRIYNLPYLITRLKYRYAGNRKNIYYDFIKNIKVEFE